MAMMTDRATAHILQDSSRVIAFPDLVFVLIPVGLARIHGVVNDVGKLLLLFR